MSQFRIPLIAASDFVRSSRPLAEVKMSQYQTFLHEFRLADRLMGNEPAGCRVCLTNEANTVAFSLACGHARCVQVLSLFLNFSATAGLFPTVCETLMPFLCDAFSPAVRKNLAKAIS